MFWSLGRQRRQEHDLKKVVRKLEKNQYLFGYTLQTDIEAPNRWNVKEDRMHNTGTVCKRLLISNGCAIR